MTHRDELAKAQWDAYIARQSPSVAMRVLSSPITFLAALALLCALPLVALAIFLWG